MPQLLAPSTSQPQKKCRIVFIRVDDNFRIFQANDPGVVIVDADGDVKDIVLYIREDITALNAFDLDQLMIYKLKTPMERVHQPLNRVPHDGTRRSVEEKKVNAFKDLEAHMRCNGMQSNLLEHVALADRVNEHFIELEESKRSYITTILSHPAMPRDYKGHTENGNEGGRLRFSQPTIVPTGSTNFIPSDLQSALEHSIAFQRLEIKSFFLERDDKGCISWDRKEVEPSKRSEFMRGPFVADGFKEDGSSVEVVIKFSLTYNAEAHKYLAKERHAPILHECRRVIGGMFMIVMDRVEGSQWSTFKKGQVSASTFNDLQHIIEAFHEAGFVHGDLRECNVMINNEGRAMVIDFDWASKDGTGRYPMDINMKNVDEKEWHPEVKRGGLIMTEHDSFALNVLKEKVASIVRT